MKKGKKLFQRLLASILSLALVVTGVSVQGLAPVNAEQMPEGIEEETRAAAEEGLILYYDFVLQNSFATEIPDASNSGNAGNLKRVSGSVEGSYSIDAVNIYGREVKALSLPGGEDGSYVQMPNGILKDCDAVTISAWVKLTTDTGYQRIWDFGSGATKYMYMLSDGGNDGFRGYAAAITEGGWTNEKGVQKGNNFDKNRWVLATVVMDGSRMSLYENGQQVGETVDTGITVKDLGDTTQNYIGYGQFGDAPTKGQFAEFKIYNRALSADEISAMYSVSDADIVAADKAELDLGDLSAVTSDFDLPAQGANGSAITWASQNDAIKIEGNTAKVTRPGQGQGDMAGTLTATITYNGVTDTKSFDVTVASQYTDQQVADHDAEAARKAVGDLSSVTGNIVLPAEGEWGSVITWESTNSAITIEDGVAKVKRPAIGSENATGKLKGTVSYQDATAVIEIDTMVPALRETATIQSVEEVNVATLVGHSPSLPNQVKVTYSDNTTNKLKVVWPEVDASKYSAPGEFTVEGTVLGTAHKAVANVTVVDEEEVAKQAVSESFDLSDISLDKIGENGSILTQNRDRDLAYLKLLDNKRMLYNFYSTFGETDAIKDVKPLGGWDEPVGLLRGHSTGHYMSALALAYASTGDAEIKAKLDEMVSELNRLQSKSKGNAEDFQLHEPGSLAGSVNPDVWSKDPNEWGEGFISAYSPDQFGLLEIYAPYGGAGSGIWAPYYTLHKLMAGFLDAYTYTGNDLALETAKKLGKWVCRRLGACSQEQLTKMWAMYIAGEFGGFNESLAQLYIYTGDQDFLDGAKLFNNTKFFDSLAANVDDIKGRHANQHIPQIIGALKMYEASVAAGSPEVKYYDIAENFWQMVVSRYAYSIGGVGTGEKFTEPYRQANNIAGTTNCETCAAYNLLKLTKMLNNYNPDDAAYMDYYERTLYNQILASQTPNVTANMHNGTTYMLPIGPGSTRDFGGDYNAFTCCHGTGMENHVKYQEAAYAKTEDTLYVGLYLPSTVAWEEKGVKVTQEMAFPSETTKLTVSAMEGKEAQAFQMKLRVPYWATKGFTVKVNNEEKAITAEASSYVALDGIKAGDVIEISMPWSLHLDKTPDQIGTSDVASVMYGPFVMAAQNSSQEWKTLVLSSNLEDSIPNITKDQNGFPVFSAKGYDFAPMFAPQYATEAYHTYFKVITTEDDGSNWYEVKLTNSSPNRGDFTVSADMVKEGEKLVITAKPKEGYAVKSLIVNGKKVQMAEDNTYTIEKMQEDVVIEGTFRLMNPQTPDPKHLEFTAEVFSDYTASWENLGGVKTDWEPVKSNDGTKKGWGNWAQETGSEHYIQYEWDTDVAMNRFDIFWYDDGGGTRIPASIKIMYRDANGSWQQAKMLSEYEDVVAVDQYNTIRFEPITTDCVKLVLTVLTQANGIYRWKAMNDDGSLKADKAALAAAIEEAGEKVQVDYTSGTWNTMRTSLARANRVNKREEALQEEVDAAATALENAIKGLGKQKADKAALTAAIEKAGELNEADYTADSWKEMQAALTAANTVKGQEDPWQSEVNAAEKALLDAIKALSEIGLMLYYDFDLENSFSTIINDASGNLNAGELKRVSGSVEGSYTIDTVNIYGQDVKALSLPGGADGTYLQMPNGILKDCDAVTISMWVKLTTDTGYQRIWDFGSDTAKYMYLLSDGGNDGFKGYASAITKEGWSKEQGVQKGTNIDKNRWVLTTVVMDGAKMSLYENGEQVGETKDTGISVKELGDTVQNYIGYGQFGDAPTKGQFAEVKIYNKALTAEQIKAKYQVTDADIVAADKADLDLGDLSEITESFELPAKGPNGSTITWASQNSAIQIDGATAKVTRPAQNQENAAGTLTATIKYKEESATKAFDVTVIAEYSDQQIVEHDAKAAKEAVGDLSSMIANVVLPAKGEWGSVITWESQNSAIRIEDGVAKVTRPEIGAANVTGKLIGTVSYNDASVSIEIDTTVLPFREEVTIVSVEEVKVTTLVGKSPSFPNYVNVTFSDGTANKLKAVWPAEIEAEKYAAAGSFTVEGSLVGEKNKVNATVTVVAEEEVAKEVVSESFDLNDITLDKIGKDGSILTQNRDRDVAYLKLLDNKRMLYNFYKTFGQTEKIEGVTPLGGWDAPSGLLRGHSTGHYMSALALAYASTSDEQIKAKLDEMVHELRELQKMSKGDAQEFETKGTAQNVWSTDPTTWGEGFLSAYSPDQFALLEQYVPYAQIWAPYYTLHKLIAGLLDAYTYTGNQEALETASALGKWVYRRLTGCTQEQLTKMWDMYIAGEFGGFNESMAQLYVYTKDADFLAGAKLFDNTKFFDNLAANVDDIKERHANQHIPQIVGALKMYEATVAAGSPEVKYYDIAENFWQMVVSRYAYSIGGVGTGEKFKQPYQQANYISGNENCETCAAYNLLKLTKMLNNYNPDNAEYMDYYERTLYNQILASQTPEVTNSMHNGTTYMLPIGPGARRSHGGDYDSFTCCHGTGMENHVKYQEAAYAKTDDTLYVGLYLPSTVIWEEKGVKVAQETAFPSDTTKLTVSAMEGKESKAFTMKLRVPYWATKGFTVTVNGEEKIKNAEISSYAVLEGIKAGDVIEVSMPWSLHLDKTPDTLDGAEVASIMYGPFVMAAKDSSTKWKTLVLSQHLEDSIPKVTTDENGFPVFTAKGLSFAPMFAPQYSSDAYHAYFKVITAADDGSNWYEVRVTNTMPYRGNVVVSAEIVKEGERLEIKANPAEGFAVAKLTVNGETVKVDADNKYVIEKMASDVDIEVVFQPPVPLKTNLEFSASSVTSDYSYDWYGQLIEIADNWEPQGHSNRGHVNWKGDNHIGDENYVQYTWDEPMQMNKFEVYWRSYGANSWLPMPGSVKVRYLVEDGTWKDANVNTEYEDMVKESQYNTIKFDTITTTAVRLVTTIGKGTQEDSATGIYRWKVAYEEGPADQVDKTALAAAIAAAGEKKQSDYTAESWSKMQTALDEAEKVNGDANATQEQVDAAAKALDDAIKALVEATPVQKPDKTALAAAIAAAGAKKQADYTAESWSKMQTALAEAEKVNGDANATQAQVDAAAKALDDAIKALVEATPVQKPDKAALAAAIAAAGEKKQSDYTAESWSKMQTALAEAKKVDGDANATQAQVDAAAKALDDATKALVKATPVVQKPGKPSSVTVAWIRAKKVKVTWKKASNAQKYVIYRSYKKSSGYKKIGETKKTTFTDKKATPGKTAYYKVIAYNGNTKGAFSAVKSVYLLKPPASIKAKAGTKKATVSFKKVAKASGYTIYRSTKANGKYKKVATLKSAKTIKKTFTKLKKGTYYFKARAYRNIGGKPVYTGYSSIVKVKVK